MLCDDDDGALNGTPRSRNEADDVLCDAATISV